MATRTTLLDHSAIASTLDRMADEIVAAAGGTGDLLLIGIQRRGVELADRIASRIEQRHGATIPRGKLDITLYRDDLQAIGPRPVVGETQLPPTLDGRLVVVVDDVLYTGRTIRAALSEFTDFGRPRRILLAVLVDRGGRELPIQADVTGLAVACGQGERVEVSVMELDGADRVELVTAGADA